MLGNSNRRMKVMHICWNYDLIADHSLKFHYIITQQYCAHSYDKIRHVYIRM